MSRGARRKRIPPAYQDIGAWPCPDTSCLTRDEQTAFLRKKHAMEMYAIGATYSEIAKSTGIWKSDLYRMLARCLSFGPNGQIFGFFALLRGTRTGTYRREKEVRHQPGSGSGGCSGALSLLFERYPEIEEMVIHGYRNDEKGAMPESRPPVIAIHDAFKKALRKLGLTDNDWPFNTENCGYKSLHNYLCSLRNDDPQGTAQARSGTEAARRGAVGTGIPSILPSLRPCGCMQLDFHKVDAASIFVLINDHGEELEIPVSRWHFGLLIDEAKGAVMGFSVVFDLNPSGDDTLEIVCSALSSRDRQFTSIHAAEHGAVLINQLLPELEYQGFSVLKVDRAWANAAHEVVNNIIDIVGCAVNFGPSRAWWCRHLIEQIFGELTRRGLQRLPSSHGKGPSDSRINDPNAQAIKFRIEVHDLIGVFLKAVREHNLSGTERLQGSSPLGSLKAALANPTSGLFLQPLPADAQAQRRLMMHVEEVTVRGNLNKNIRPYFNLDRHKHTNSKLAKNFALIGKTLIVYVDRRLARNVYAVVKETGEQLGRMRLTGAWANSDCTWRFRKMMIRSALGKRYRGNSEDPMEDIKQEKMNQLKERPKSSARKSSRTALEVVRIEAQQSRVEHIHLPADPREFVSDAPARRTSPVGKSDPFGVNAIPQIDQ